MTKIKKQTVMGSRDKRPEIEKKLKKKEITITAAKKKNVKQSRYPSNHM